MIKDMFFAPWAPLVALTEQGLGPVHKKLNGNLLDHYAKDPWMVFATQNKAAVCYSFNRGREEGGEVFKSLSTGSRGCNTYKLKWSMTLLALFYDMSEVQRIESVFCVFAILISTSS